MSRKTIAIAFQQLFRQLRLLLGMGCLLGVGLLGFSVQVLGASWQSLAPGIDYVDATPNRLIPWSHVHVFRIDLQENRLDLIMAEELSLPHASINEYAEHSNALIAINGGFFDPNFHPLGLRISGKKAHSRLKGISWWGIFYIKHNKAYLRNFDQFTPNKHIDFAVQSGPRLLIQGKIPPLKPGRAERTALGITQEGRVIIVVTENAMMTTTELAELMRSPIVQCEQALNLDGGSSTQLRANIRSFQLDVHGFSPVSDAIVVQPSNRFTLTGLPKLQATS